MRVAAVIVILWCLFSVCSCGGGSRMGARFQEIDRLTDSLPLEAIRSLDSINTAGLSEKELYRYRLLWIKSRDKAYITHRSDTLILDVIDYYDRHRSEGLYPEALYYGGRVYSDLGDLPTALEFFQKSLNEIPEDDQHLHFRNIVLNQTGRLLQTLRLDSEAIEHLEKSLNGGDPSKDAYGITFTHTLIAGSFRRQNNNQLARKHIDEAVKLSSKLNERDRQTILSEFAYMLYKEGKLDSARLVIGPLPSTVDTFTVPFCLAVAANIYKDAGILDTAYMYARRLTKLNTPYNKKTGYKVIFSDELKEYVRKDTLLKLIPEYKQTIEDYLDTHEAEQALIQNARYNYSTHVRAKEKAEADYRSLRTTVIVILGSIAALVFLAVIWVLWRKYQKTKNDSEVMEAMVFVEKLREETDQTETVADEQAGQNQDEASEDTKDVRRKIHSHIDALKDRNVRSLIDSRLLESQVYKELRDRMDSNECIGRSDDILKRLSELIETVTPGFGNRLDILTDWAMSDRERNVALLMRCGFSNSQIATLLAKSKSTISSQRNAIAKKAGLTVNGINAAIASL